MSKADRSEAVGEGKSAAQAQREAGYEAIDRLRREAEWTHRQSSTPSASDQGKGKTAAQVNADREFESMRTWQAAWHTRQTMQDAALLPVRAQIQALHEAIGAINAELVREYGGGGLVEWMHDCTDEQRALIASIVGDER